MQKKQLFASLEIAEDEIRLLVGEYYMSRFNILRSDIQKCTGVSNRKIVNPQLVSATITKCIRQAEEALGMKLKSVILSIPSVDVTCIRRRVNVPIEEGSRRIFISHIRRGLNEAIKGEEDNGSAFVNVGSIKYITGGIASRTMPLDEKAEMLTMELDLLYANKEIVYSYVMCVEKAGVGILDICLDSYAMAEESAALENSMNTYIVLLDLSRYSTTISLYHKGNLVGSDCDMIGYETWIQALRKKYHLSLQECKDIVSENCFLDNGQYDDSVSHIWLDHEESKQLTKMEVYNTVYEEARHWLKTINEACSFVTDKGDAKLILAGQGSDIVGISSLTKLLEVPTELYFPSAIGARDSRFTATLGALYCVKKWQQIRNDSETSVEVSDLTPREREREDQSAFTKKLKNILLMNKQS